MVETSGRGGLGWLWLLLAFMFFIGAFVAAVASLFPEGISFSQPAEPAPLEEFAPLEEEAVVVDIEDVINDPSRYLGKRVIAIVRVTDIVTDRILWLGSREYVNRELFAVVARGIDLKASDFRIWQIVKVYGSVRPFQEDDLKSQGLEIGRRIRAATTTEKGYLLIEGRVPNNPDLRLLLDQEEDSQLAEDSDLSQDGELGEYSDLAQDGELGEYSDLAQEPELDQGSEEEPSLQFGHYTAE